jgi:PleD family two-component response regulator
LELPEGALTSVDAVVTKYHRPRYLLEAIRAVLQAKDRQHFDKASAELAAPLEEAIPTPAKCQILVVDDDPGVRESVAMTLMAAGHDVVSTEDGFCALIQESVEDHSRLA